MYKETAKEVGNVENVFSFYAEKKWENISWLPPPLRYVNFEWIHTTSQRKMWSKDSHLPQIVYFITEHISILITLKQNESFKRKTLWTTRYHVESSTSLTSVNSFCFSIQMGRDCTLINIVLAKWDEPHRKGGGSTTRSDLERPKEASRGMGSSGRIQQCCHSSGPKPEQ